MEDNFDFLSTEFKKSGKINLGETFTNFIKEKEMKEGKGQNYENATSLIP